MKKLVRMALKYRYNKCTWQEFTNLIKLTLAAEGKKTTDVVIRKVALKAMEAAKGLVEGR